MHSTSFLRLAPVAGALALASLGADPAAHAAKFPPLNEPASNEQIPGKLVWADLFTTDPESATKFDSRNSDFGPSDGKGKSGS